MESHDGQPEGAYDELPTESHESHESYESYESPESPESLLVQPPWRIQQQGRVVVVALLGAVVAFVAVLAFHVLTRPPAVTGPGAGGSAAVPTAPEQAPPGATGLARHAHSQKARNARHPSARAKRGHPAAVALRSEGHVVVRISTVSVAPPQPERASATSEFTFER
jgi:hypothetical protein